MAQTRKSASSRAADDAEQASAKAAAESGAQQAAPVITRRKKKKKRKRKYTRGTKDLQRFGDGLTKGAWRVGRAVERGIDDFYKRSRKSSRRRRDGAVRDIWKNSAKGYDSAFRQLGKAPYDVARMLPGRSIWRATRPAVTFFTSPFIGFFR